MKIYVLLFYAGLFLTLQAQPKSNYDIILDLIPGSVEEVSEATESKDAGLTIVLPPGSAILSNRVFSSALNINKNIISGTFDDKKNIIYTLENIKIDYGEVFHRGFPGDYYCERVVELSGVNILEKGSEVLSFPFNVNFTDTIFYDQISELEKKGPSFAKGVRPEEPFFRSLIEPTIAVAAAIVTVYLFFDVRSK